MSYLQHLEEFRRRLIVCFIALVVGIFVCWYFGWDILYIIKRPAGDMPLNYLKPIEPFLCRFKLSLFGALIICLPVILYEVLAFLSPALEEKERRLTFAVLAMVIFFFACGVVLGYFYILPVGIKWLLGLAGKEMTAVISASEYISFAGWFLLAFGIAFETPMFIWLLVALDILSPEDLRKQWRYAYIIILVLSAIITPDWNPVTMLMVGAPMIALYEISIALAKISAKRKAAKEEELEKAEAIEE
ncbi:MAG: twin-arginine translocase subunit TatC [Actinomycetota bacterium]|nr:twin-arginine translocase subunit TatC [Actinomycetota bacterium]